MTTAQRRSRASAAVALAIILAGCAKEQQVVVRELAPLPSGVLQSLLLPDGAVVTWVPEDNNDQLSRLYLQVGRTRVGLGTLPTPGLFNWPISNRVFISNASGGVGRQFRLLTYDLETSRCSTLADRVWMQRVSRPVSSHGKHILLPIVRPDAVALQVKEVESGRLLPLGTASGLADAVWDVSGNEILYARTETSGLTRVYRILLSRRALQTHVADVVRAESGSVRLSPGGDFIAYVTGQSGNESLICQRLSTGERYRVAAAEGGEFRRRSLCWSADGRWLAAVTESPKGAIVLFETRRMVALSVSAATVGQDVQVLGWRQDSKLVVQVADESEVRLMLVSPVGRGVPAERL